MHLTQQQRESLLHEAEYAFLELMGQIDCLFETTGCYIVRYPTISKSDTLRNKDLLLTITELGLRSTQLADAIKRWKQGEPRTLDRVSVEILILNEIWTNIVCLVMFFACNGQIDTSPYSHPKARVAWLILRRVNNLIL
jgi:hypothetical protein